VFQSPSLRGSGRFVGEAEWPTVNQFRFQSPSLRGSGRFLLYESLRKYDHNGFNPLHCGAVVASGSRSAGARRGGASFNPLHCGAVVASVGLRAMGR